MKELQAVSERVVGIDPPESGEVAVPAGGLPSVRQACGDRVEVVDEDAGVAFASGTKVVLDAQVQLDAAGAEPGAAPGGEHGWLVDLSHAKDVDEEGARLLLLVARHGELRVMEPGEHVPMVSGGWGFR